MLEGGVLNEHVLHFVLVLILFGANLFWNFRSAFERIKSNDFQVFNVAVFFIVFIDFHSLEVS